MKKLSGVLKQYGSRLLALALVWVIGLGLIPLGQIAGATTSSTASDLAFTMPTTAGSTYSVSVYLRQFYNGTGVGLSSASGITLSLELSDGTVTTVEPSILYGNLVYDGAVTGTIGMNWEASPTEMLYTITGIPAGAVLTMLDVPTADNVGQWNEYNAVTATVYPSSSSGESMTAATYDLVAGGTTAVTLAATGGSTESGGSGDTGGSTAGDKQTTTDVFTAWMGDPLTYLLNRYNVVSFGNIEATHIVGPILTQDAAFRTRTNETLNEEKVELRADLYQLPGHESIGNLIEYLAAADYSDGQFSYVGEFKLLDGTDWEGKYTAQLAINYGIDDDYDVNFTPPYLYTRETGLDIDTTTSSWQEFFIIEDLLEGSLVDKLFVSPNNTGMTPTYQNDNFIDWDAMQKALVADSVELHENGSMTGATEIIEIDMQTIEQEIEEGLTTGNIPYFGKVSVEDIAGKSGLQLNLLAGYSYRISGIGRGEAVLNTINLFTEDGLGDDFSDISALKPTTISFSDSEINPAVIGGVYHSRLPDTLINGEMYKADTLGEGVEYGEVGNHIIWNLPYVVTNMDTAENRLARMNPTGNHAGHIVAPQADFWNYGETSDGSLEWGGGNINGGVIVQSFQSGNIETHMWRYEGKEELLGSVSLSVEKYITADGTTELAGSGYSGAFSFQLDLVGDQPAGLNNTSFPMTVTLGSSGTAQFSTLTFNDVGTYQFKLTEVQGDNALMTYDSTVYTVTVTVTADANGDGKLDTAVSITDQSGNTTTNTKLPFTNIVNEEGKATFSFYKKDEQSVALSGAVFTLTNNDDSTDVRTATSGSDGLVTFAELPYNSSYTMTETTAPTDHILAVGYWTVTVDSTGTVTVDSTKVDRPYENNTITNESTKEIYASFTMTKVDMTSNLPLAGAIFTVVEVESILTPNPVTDGYSTEFTSDADGLVTITGLEKGTIYKVTETKAPGGYLGTTEVWYLEVGSELTTQEDGSYTYSVTLYDGAGAVTTDSTVENEQILYTLPETGGMGTSPFYLMGLVLMSVAILLVHKPKCVVKKNVL